MLLISSPVLVLHENLPSASACTPYCKRLGPFHHKYLKKLSWKYITWRGENQKSFLRIHSPNRLHITQIGSPGKANLCWREYTTTDASSSPSPPASPLASPSEFGCSLLIASPSTFSDSSYCSVKMKFIIILRYWYCVRIRSHLRVRAKKTSEVQVGKVL